MIGTLERQHLRIIQARIFAEGGSRTLTRASGVSSAT
jgi:hypothetical protein